MPIPDFQSVMLPVLQCLASGQVVDAKSIRKSIAEVFSLNDEEKQELLPSGKQTVINNRIGWAITYMKKAGLISSAGKGQYLITDNGQKVLASNLNRIDVKFLKQFSAAFKDFHQAKPSGKQQPEEVEKPLVDDETPDEMLQQAYSALNKNLAEELLENIKGLTPAAFEQLVVELMVAMGYGGARKDAAQQTSLSNDNGIDGIINEDKLGLDVIYLQAKKWEDTVHRPEIDKFIGALTRQAARKGVFITTSEFSQGAKEASKGLNISVVLIDGRQLAKLMIEHNLGVSIQESYHVKTMDSDYFDRF
jgi:restriction system protein